MASYGGTQVQCSQLVLAPQPHGFVRASGQRGNGQPGSIHPVLFDADSMETHTHTAQGQQGQHRFKEGQNLAPCVETITLEHTAGGLIAADHKPAAQDLSTFESSVPCHCSDEGSRCSVTANKLAALGAQRHINCHGDGDASTTAWGMRVAVSRG